MRQQMKPDFQISFVGVAHETKPNLRINCVNAFQGDKIIGNWGVCGYGTHAFEDAKQPVSLACYKKLCGRRRLQRSLFRPFFTLKPL